jgi:hypothetical protein
MAILLVGWWNIHYVVGFIEIRRPSRTLRPLVPPFAPLLFCDGAAFALLADLWFRETGRIA